MRHTEHRFGPTASREKGRVRGSDPRCFNFFDPDTGLAIGERRRAPARA